MQLLTTRTVLLRVALIVALAELLIMFVLGVSRLQASSYSLAILDVVFLALLTTPALYLWVVKPFVDARDAMLSQLNELASTDPLTQLANRRALLEQLDKVLAGSAKHGIPAAVLMVDLDDFKRINDAHGHDIGDAVLVETASRIRSVTRSEDVASRWGGDEFVVVINRIASDERLAAANAMRTAEKLITLINSPMVLCGLALHVEVSIGIRLLGFEKLDSRTALAQADLAMYRAKQMGTGSPVLFEG